MTKNTFRFVISFSGDDGMAWWVLALVKPHTKKVCFCMVRICNMKQWLDRQSASRHGCFFLSKCRLPAFAISLFQICLQLYKHVFAKWTSAATAYHYYRMKIVNQVTTSRQNQRTAGNHALNSSSTDSSLIPVARSMSRKAWFRFNHNRPQNKSPLSTQHTITLSRSTSTSVMCSVCFVHSHFQTNSFVIQLCIVLNCSLCCCLQKGDL